MVRVQISRNGSTPFHFKVSTKDIDIDDSVDESHFEGDVEIDGEITDGGNVFNVKGKIKCRKFFIYTSLFHIHKYYFPFYNFFS